MERVTKAIVFKFNYNFSHLSSRNFPECPVAARPQKLRQEFLGRKGEAGDASPGRASPACRKVRASDYNNDASVIWLLVPPTTTVRRGGGLLTCRTR